jgi:hypothetical protein
MLPSGYSTEVGDYILVALPTFLYFTAFTLIVNTWVVITSVDLTKLARESVKLVNRLSFIVNFLMYPLARSIRNIG